MSTLLVSLAIKSWDHPPGAPVFGPSLQCPPTVARKDVFDIAATVTYEGVSPQPPNAGSAQPVTFHTWTLKDPEEPRHGFRLYRRRDGDQDWEECDFDDGSSGATLFVDDPDVAVSVADAEMEEHFVNLRPGESWMMSKRLQGQSWSCPPEDLAPGQVIRYVFKGAEVDWWNWDSKEDLKSMVMKLPPWIAGKILGPRNNDGRPRLVVSEKGRTKHGSPADAGDMRL
ncbi:hypothetical protein F4780DRAFT_786967 [Xylariomycetidae sp. FL0641]|nr:hypothetical protein F4780DRAFT_786967 [Xylariomycetidae sp. FL0641]